MKFALWICGLLALGMLIPSSPQTNTSPSKDMLARKSAPFTQFYLQRSAPGQEMDLREFNRVMDVAAQSMAPSRNTDMPWKQEGPLNIGGRLNCVTIHPDDPDTWYVGASAGGIFRTTDAGETWEPISDSFDYLPIADIVFDPNNSNVVFAATGDPNISGTPHPGNGIYKSTDGGDTWSHLGLEEGVIISKILVSPSNSNIMYAGAMGLPFAPTDDRGLYRSTDGGETWAQVHFIDNETGIIDLVMNPAEPEVLYAASWRRIRNNQESIISGESCRIWRSADGGSTWQMCTEGLPQGEQCRIGLATSGTDPQRVFALIISPEFQIEGIYRSDDAGLTWGNVNWDQDQMFNAMGGFGWYFAKLHVDPEDDGDISVLGVDLWTTTNGGSDWFMSVPAWWEYLVHADKHDMETLPDGSLLICTDGGLYRHSGNLSPETIYDWEDVDEIPNTQFYHVGLNPFDTEHYTGGAQDNGTTTGNQEMWTSWTRDLGGDGFQPYFDPETEGLRYGAIQYGELRYLDGSGWGGWEDFTVGIDEDDRVNWDMPYVMSAHDPTVFYTGTYRMYRMDNAPYGNWIEVSDDLTDGVIFGDNYHTISAIGESPVQDGLLYCGTTDANVWRSEDWGDSWADITADLPERYVTNIKCSPENANTVFVTHNGYKDNDETSYIHRSDDGGSTWISVAGDLPELPVNHLEVWNDTTLVIATDVGVYFTENGGDNWQRVGNNMPMIPVFDLEFNTAENELVAATFARSMMTYPLDSLITEPEVVDGIDEALRVDFNVYPNPVVSTCTLESDAVSGQLRVFNAAGALVLNERVGRRYTLDMTSWAAGTYTCRLETPKGTAVQQVVKAGQ